MSPGKLWPRLDLRSESSFFRTIRARWNWRENLQIYKVIRGESSARLIEQRCGEILCEKCSRGRELNSRPADYESASPDSETENRHFFCTSDKSPRCVPHFRSVLPPISDCPNPRSPPVGLLFDRTSNVDFSSWLSRPYCHTVVKSLVSGWSCYPCPLAKSSGRIAEADRSESYQEN